MSAQHPNLYTQKFRDNVELLSQQNTSRLMGLVSLQTGLVGKQLTVVNQVGALTARKVTTRGTPLAIDDAALTRRWYLPVDYELAQQIDKFDKLKSDVELEGHLVKTAVAAKNRAIDDEVIAAFFADAKTGETGSGTTSFTAGNVVVANHEAASNVGLTVNKLREVIQIMLEGEVDLDMEEVWMAITAKQHDDLLNEIQVTSTDYNNRAVLVDGKVQRFMGINFVRSQRLLANGSGHRRCPAWVKSGMALGVWADENIRITERDDLTGFPWQAYWAGSYGATRLQETKVVEVVCA